MSSPSDADDTGPDNPEGYENLEFTDSDFTFNDFQNQTCGFYTDYRGKQIYRYDSGILQLPVASETVDGTIECELVQVYAPIGQRIVQFTAENEGLPPKMPDPFQDINENEVVITAVVTWDFPVPLPSGLGYAYRAQGEYTYASKKPWVPTAGGGSTKFANGGIQGGATGFPMGLMPMMKSAVNGTGNSTGVTACPSSRFVHDPPIVETDNDDILAVCPNADAPESGPATGTNASPSLDG